MSRKDRLVEVYEHLRTHYPIHTKNDFAEKINYHRTYISSAMNGNERYLTDKLFMNICEAFPGVFNLDYLLTGEGELTLRENKKDVTQNPISRNVNNDLGLDISNMFNAAIASKNEVIDSLKRELETSRELIEEKSRTIRLLEQKIEVLEAMQHIDPNNPLRSPFPIGIAEPNNNNERAQV